jgi:hypothetical protein
MSLEPCYYGGGAEFRPRVPTPFSLFQRLYETLLTEFPSHGASAVAALRQAISTAMEDAQLIEVFDTNVDS